MSRLIVPAVVSLAAVVGIASGMGWTGPLVALGVLAFLALLVWDIRVVVPLLIFVIPFGPKYEMAFGNLYLATIIVGAAFGVWVWRNPLLRDPFQVPRTPVLVALGAMFAAMGLSAIQGIYHLLANPPQLMRFIQFFLYAWLFIAVIQMRLSRGLIRGLLIFALLVGVAQGLVGVHQWVTAPGFYLTGTFDDAHNNFAIYIVFMTLLLVGVALEARRPWVGALAMAGMAPLVASAVLSFSRGGYVALVIGLPVFFLLPVRPSRKLLLLGACAVVVLLTYAAVPVDVRLRAQSILMNVTGRDVGISAAARFEMWKAGFRDFLESPVVGKGTWTYGVRDNFYMKILGEAGLLGFAAFIALIYYVLKEEVKALTAPLADDLMRGVASGLLPATVACVVIYNLTGDYMLVHRFMGVFWIVLALVLKYKWEGGQSGVSNAE
jgi:hypothetical protein